MKTHGFFKFFHPYRYFSYAFSVYMGEGYPETNSAEVIQWKTKR